MLVIKQNIYPPIILKYRNFKDSSLADKFQMLLLTFFSENKQKNHKSSPRRGEDLEKGYPCEGLGDLSPNYLVGCCKLYTDYLKQDSGVSSQESGNKK